MTFLEILRKLGILRFGSKKATYRSAKDRPDELMFPGVFDAKKDQIHKGDVDRFLGKDKPRSM